MIKAVFFDFDGVLTESECGSSTVCKNLSDKAGVPFEKLLSCYDIHARELYITLASYKTIWSSFCECVGKDISIELLDYAFRNVQINEKMFELVERIRKNYKVGIITDNTKERFDAIVDYFKLREKFDAIILSADVGATKKSEEIFKIALKSLQLKPEECVFIDNSKKNLDIPTRMGFHTIHYDFWKKDFEGLIEKINYFELKI